jgi:hypothetical protein
MNSQPETSIFTIRSILVGSGVFVVALLPRLLLAIFEPALSGDAPIYETVATNILTNGCVSLAGPATGACLPHWGGNQFPGFPAFIALIWAFFPENWTSVSVAHSVIFSLSILYLWFALDRYLNSKIVALLTIAVVALSPLGLPWARFSLSETLTLSIVVILTAELIRSLDQGRLRIPLIGLTLSIGFFIRFDTIFLSIPVAFVGFYLHSPAVAIRRGFMIFVILALPALAWCARGIAVGLGPVPQTFFIASGYEPPLGYLAWARGWATSQYQAPMWWYPVQHAEYSKITLPEVAGRTAAERTRVEELLNNLKSHDYSAFPKALDEQFQELADNYRFEHPFEYWIRLPIERIWRLWFNPLNSAGWPVDVGWTGGIPDSPLLFDLVVSNPLTALVKGGSTTYRLILPLLAILLLAFIRRRLSPAANLLLWASVAHLLLRSIFLGWGFFIETRYLLQIVPLLEVSLMFALSEIHHSSKTGEQANLSRDTISK